MRSRQLLVLVASLALAGGCMLLDHLTGDELAFTIFYVAPIVVAAWLGGRRTGVLIALVCGAAWLGDDLLIGVRSHPAVHYWNAAVTLAFFLIIALGLAHIRDDNEKLAAMTLTDPMTGIANARAYFRRAEQALERMRDTHRPLTAAYLDLDNFKGVNDTHGHLAGDRLLCEVARGLQTGVRATDFVARLGGDEFAVLLEETDSEEAGRVLDRLRVELAQRVTAAYPAVTVSLGAVTFTDAPSDAEQLQHRADEAMYAVKSRGKNSIRLERA